MTSRTRTMRWGLAVVALFVVLSVSAPVSGATEGLLQGPSPGAPHQRSVGVDHPLVGAAYHALWGERTNRQRREVFDRLAHLHAKWVRISFPWALAQPQRPTHADNGWSAWGLGRVDDVVKMAAHRGLKVSFTFVGTPKWANGGRGASYLPTRPATYARAIRFLAARYRGTVMSWEIWNEANHNQYLKGATVGDYTRLLCRAYPAVHRGAPGARVISAGTGGVDWAWVGRLYRAGAKRCFDVLAVHPYNRDRSPYYAPGSEPALWLRNMSRVRHVMRSHHDTATPVWFTEFGWSTHGGDNGVTRKQQAKFLVQMLKITDKRLPYVERMSWYMAKDEHTSDVSHGHYGLYSYNMRPKPAAGAMRRYLANAR